jgi:CheY-like chemotaxis protein
MSVVGRTSSNSVILYVEDDALTRQSIAQLLLRRGFHVLQAASGEEALDLIDSGTVPTAMLLDLELPGIDGMETYRRVRQIHPALAAVVCTARLTAPLRRELSELGVAEDCQLSKPCVFREILDALRRAMGNASEG